MRYLQIVHALPGRTRLRYPWLRHDPAAVEHVADALAATPAVREVKIRPYTGSILVHHDPETTSAALADVARQVLACARVVGVGEPTPLDPEVPKLSRIAKLAATAFREIDREVRRKSGGSFDLGTLATLGFFGATAVEVAVERELPVPPWWNLAWWGYNTFILNEQAEIAAACGDQDTG